MRFLLVEPYDTGSHAVWMRGYQAHSAHEVEILSLDGQFWQWRMLGGAAELAGQFLRRGREPDLIVASDMLDLTTFLALTRPHTARIPSAVYFHENQITYPAGPRQKEQQHYAFINAMSALAADAVFFNSAFHRADFLRDLPGLLNHFPDHRLPGTEEAIRAKSAVLPVGIDLARYDAHRPAAPRDPSRPLLIVWNHRWEYDKNPETFFAALDVLAGEGVPFEVALVGENTRQSVPEFDAALQKLEKGQFTTEPVKTAYGFHVIQLDDIRRAEAPKFEEVKDRVMESMQQQAVQTHIESLMSKAKVQ